MKEAESGLGSRSDGLVPKNVLARRIRSALVKYHVGKHSGNGSPERTAIYALLRQYDPETYSLVEAMVHNKDLSVPPGESKELIDLVAKRVLNPVRRRRS